MSKRVEPIHFVLVLLLLAVVACRPTTATVTPGSSPPAQTPRPDTVSGTPILIGTEYILIENPARTKALAELLAPIGLSVAKPLPEHIEWGKMQPTPDAPIDFDRLDNFVRQFQAAGFTELILALKSHNPWASKTYGLFVQANDAPKPEYMDDYENWIFTVVERYDGDGSDDLPDLLYPIRFYEIGSEFSSYEPEPVEEYLAMLERAYAAAHRAYDEVIVTHAAFLTTLAFANNPGPAEYEAAFEAVPDENHGLADIRQVLDRPDLFDVINIHALGDPYEIEAIVAWLNYEMVQRGYEKNIIIADTATTPFIAWGPATACDRNPNQMGHIIPPAAEADRCRLAEYFNKLVEGDEQVLRWVQAFSAEDVVKKVVVAAEQGILLINTAFTEDLIWLKLPIAQAGAGNSAWAGLVDFERREYRPGYYALQQLIGHLSGYESITRLPFDDYGIRVYELVRAGQRSWIAWYDPGRLILPDDPLPETSMQLAVGVPAVTIENLITQFGESNPNRTNLTTQDGVITLTLNPRPIFIYYDETAQP